jgi:hypothetical protein
MAGPITLVASVRAADSRAKEPVKVLKLVIRDFSSSSSALSWAKNSPDWETKRERSPGSEPLKASNTRALLLPASPP